jgi:hypothetical protein
MPESPAFRELRRVADNLTQSVAHHAYFGQEFADRYGLPSLLLPAYTDLSEYEKVAAPQKDMLIIYSPDFAVHREGCLAEMKAGLPGYKFVEITGMSFDHYMDLASRCRYAVSFGEGFDGYVAQPIYQGGIGLTLFNEEFFPSASFRRFPNFFADPSTMGREAVELIGRLDGSEEEYVALNRRLVQEWEALYSYSDYVFRIGLLARKEFEIFPSQATVKKPQDEGRSVRESRTSVPSRRPRVARPA